MRTLSLLEQIKIWMKSITDSLNSVCTTAERANYLYTDLRDKYLRNVVICRELSENDFPTGTVDDTQRLSQHISISTTFGTENASDPNVKVFRFNSGSVLRYERILPMKHGDDYEVVNFGTLKNYITTATKEIIKPMADYVRRSGDTLKGNFVFEKKDGVASTRVTFGNVEVISTSECNMVFDRLTINNVRTTSKKSAVNIEHVEKMLRESGFLQADVVYEKISTSCGQTLANAEKSCDKKLEGYLKNTGGIGTGDYEFKNGLFLLKDRISIFGSSEKRARFTSNEFADVDLHHGTVESVDDGNGKSIVNVKYLESKAVSAPQPIFRSGRIGVIPGSSAHQTLGDRGQYKMTYEANPGGTYKLLSMSSNYIVADNDNGVPNGTQLFGTTPNRSIPGWERARSGALPFPVDYSIKINFLYGGSEYSLPFSNFYHPGSYFEIMLGVDSPQADHGGILTLIIEHNGQIQVPWSLHPMGLYDKKYRAYFSLVVTSWSYTLT